ncbi:MAG: sigma-70 family RNA polymerase sigma factor [Bacteriovoracia bacterium]
MTTDAAEQINLEDLAKQAQNGSSDAYRNLLIGIQEYTEKKIRRSASITRAERIDEIVQEILLSVHRSFHTYDPKRPFMPWVNAVLSYRLKDFLRQLYAIQEVQTEDGNLPDQIAPDTTAEVQLLELLEKKLSGLSPIQQRVFRMLKLEGKSIKETAIELNLSESAVKVSAHRTYKKLQADLKDGFNEK